jgi:predicted Rdx family selenoprotein
MTQEFDIDLGVYFCWKGDRDEGNFEPKELKQFVQESLKQFASHK